MTEIDLCRRMWSDPGKPPEASTAWLLLQFEFPPQNASLSLRNRLGTDESETGGARESKEGCAREKRKKRKKRERER